MSHRLPAIEIENENLCSLYGCLFDVPLGSHFNNLPFIQAKAHSSVRYFFGRKWKQQKLTESNCVRKVIRKADGWASLFYLRLNFNLNSLYRCRCLCACFFFFSLRRIIRLKQFGRYFLGGPMLFATVKSARPSKCKSKRDDKINLKRSLL